MGKWDTDREEFNRFMRTLISNTRLFVYLDDAKKFMRLLIQCAPIAAVRPLRQREWEPIVSKEEYMLSKISFDHRQHLKDSVPKCLRVIAFQMGGREDRHQLLQQMIVVASEIMGVVPETRTVSTNPPSSSLDSKDA